MSRPARSGTRNTRSRPMIEAGCFDCHGEYTVEWTAANAQALAAQHAYRTGHHTYADVQMTFHYNRPEGR